MAFDAFLKIDGIDGESQSEGHEKWIELLSFSWGAAVAESADAAGAGSGRGRGRISPQDFTFVKVTDTASPKIFLKMCQGTHFQKVSLACRRAGGLASDVAGAPQADFIAIDFYNVLFASYAEGGTTATDQRPLDSITFAFSKIELQAAAMLADGTVDFSNGGFDFRASKSV